MVLVSALQIELLAGGVEAGLPLWVAAAAFALSQVVGSASSLPFGIGPADAVLIAFLVHAGTGPEGALAITLLTRLAVTVPLGLAGAAAYLRLSHGGAGPGARAVTVRRPGRVAVVGGAGFHRHARGRAAGRRRLGLCWSSTTSPTRAASRCRRRSELVEASGGSAEARAALARFRPDALIHLAAKGGVNRALRDPAGHISERPRAVRRLLRGGPGRRLLGGAHRLVGRGGVRRPGCPARLRASATGAAFRLRRREALRGDVPLATLAQQGVRTVALRYGNVYGPRQDGTGEAGVVAITRHPADRRAAARVIYGDGLQTRDFVYVEDVADATVAAVAQPAAAGAVNVGTGRETSVRDIVDGLVELTGSAAGIESQPGRPARCAAPPSMHRGPGGG